MNTIPNPDSWADVITIVIVTLIVAGPTWIAARTQQKIREVHQTVAVVKEQVVSTATASPLRSDVDEMRTALSSLRDEVRGGFSSLRADLAEERSARRDGDVQLREEVERVERRAGDDHLRDDIHRMRDETR
ncbi:MAG: DUF2746 domain-containing protein [Dehalococcoidia bacterium]|nr:DUF2746 domain-containing protein [Dehalococcoidia bacterium]